MTRFITVEQTLHRVGLSRTELYRLIGKGAFPKQVPIGAYKVAFVEAEVDGWISDRLKARDIDEGRSRRLERSIRATAAKSTS